MSAEESVETHEAGFFLPQSVRTKEDQYEVLEVYDGPGIEESRPIACYGLVDTGRTPRKLPIQVPELTERPAVMLSTEKPFRAERNFIQEKERLESGLRTRLDSVTEEKENLHQQLWVLGHYHEKVEDLMQNLAASEHKLKSRIEASKVLEQDLQTAQDEHAVTVKTLAQKLSGSESQARAGSKKIDSLEKRNRELQYDLREKTTQLQQIQPPQPRGRTLSQIEHQLHTEIETQTQKIKELTIKMERQEEQVRDVQQLAIQMKGKPQHAVLADSEIREELECEFANMKDWAKKWAVLELTRSSNDYESSSLQKELQKVVLVGTPPKQSTKDLLKQVRPRIAVHALLAHFIAERIFQPCFLPLDEAAKTSSAATFSTAMTHLFDLFLRKNTVEAHAWRAQTLKLLPAAYPPTCTTDDGLANDFLAGPSKLLLKQQQTNQQQELTAIITSTRALSSNIWKRRVALEIRGLDYYKRQPYRGDSDEMEAHRVHRLEEGGRERDGSAVQMVVQPGFFARGDEDGKGYERTKVWGKAVVLLEET
ncbi:hypothetical protein MMC07_001475 [Pseudocyphellaria aurata]|nr:hypothetical protein [Pseudocyphellaria aurata]